jgi:hypothetical protein
MKPAIAAVGGSFGRARFALRELVLWASLYGLYLVIRGASIGDLDEATAHAWQLVHAEQALGVFHEQSLQNALAPAAELFSAYYMLGFGPLLAAVLVWLLLRHRDLYRRLRTVLFVSLGAALVFYVMYPTAPPRLVPDLGIADTVGLSWDGDTAGTPEAGRVTGSFVGLAYNPYAAMPSMHVGWALLVGWFACRAARRLPLRLFFLLHPALMTIAVTATGNHYFLDSVLGATVALIAVAALAAMERLAHAERSRFGGEGTRPLRRPRPYLPLSMSGDEESARRAA